MGSCEKTHLLSVSSFSSCPFVECRRLPGAGAFLTFYFLTRAMIRVGDPPDDGESGTRTRRMRIRSQSRSNSNGGGTANLSFFSRPFGREFGRYSIQNLLNEPGKHFWCVLATLKRPSSPARPRRGPPLKSKEEARGSVGTIIHCQWLC